MATPSGWNELADLRRRLERVEPVVTDVARLQEKMGTLTQAVERNTTATEHVARQLEDAKIEPLTRARNLRHQAVITIGGAIAGGVFVLLGVVLSKL